MKILLTAVNAKYIHSNLAIYCLKAYAKEYLRKQGEPGAGGQGTDGVEIELAEYTINQQVDDILRDIYKRRPDVLCFSCYIWNIEYVEALVREIGKLRPGMPIWLGGPEVSYDAADVLGRLLPVRGVIKGEGEETFAKLCRVYRSGLAAGEEEKSLAEVRGIAYRDKDGRIRENPARRAIDLCRVPFIYGSLPGTSAEEGDGEAPMSDFRNKIIYYESSRGCPFSCSYCLSSVDKQMRFRDLDLVQKELQFLIDREVPQVKFVDRTFNCRHEHAAAIWRYIAEHDRGITNFHFEVAADLLNEEELGILEGMRPGLVQLEIGVQSTNPDTLRKIRRRMDFGRVRGAVERIRKGKNIHQHLDLIAGLPYEGYESFRQSFNRVYRMQPQQLQLGFLKVLKGSRMERMAEEYGCVYLEREPYEVLKTNWISYGEILSLKQVESMVEIYYNSGQFEHTLPLLEGLFSSPFALYEELGRFYEEKGYGQISHSRMRRYEILLEFLEERNQERLEAAREAMTVDLYSREKLKSRPDWMSGQEAWQKAIRDYIRREGLPKTVHIEVLSGETLLFDYRYRNPLTNNVEGQKIVL